MPTNAYGQNIGEELAGWEPPPSPPRAIMSGRVVVLEPLEPARHIPQLVDALVGSDPSWWTYTPYGPFEDQADVAAAVHAMAAEADWQSYVIVTDGAAGGFANYLRIKPRDGVIEVGGIGFGATLRRTTAATEALYLMIQNVFELGYRRCEWKCDELNDASRSAAERLGFVYEGTFRQAAHYKGRNRDTAWYAIVSETWPRHGAAIRSWLEPGNFDAAGNQRQPLAVFRASP